MKNKIYKVINPFCLITDKEAKINFWIPKKAKDNTMICVAGFDVKSYPLFIDNLAKLKYLDLHSISVIDGDLSYVYIHLHENVNMDELIEDISELLYQYVENYDKHTTVHTGKRKCLG